MSDELHRLVARIAPDPGPGLTPLARELLDEITATSRPPVRPARSRWRLVPAAALLAAAVLVTGWLLPFSTPASAALDVERDGTDYIITVRELSAAPDRYRAELRERGLDIKLSVVPVSPPLAGQILVDDAGAPGRAITTIAAPGPCRRFAGCPIAIRVPAGYRGGGTIIVGRPATEGEKYGMMPGIGMPGEPLHCVDHVNKSVAEVLVLLRERGVQADWTSHGGRLRETPPGGWYVHDGVMVAHGKALMLTGPAPRPGAQPPSAFC